MRRRRSITRGTSRWFPRRRTMRWPSPSESARASSGRSEVSMRCCVLLALVGLAAGAASACASESPAGPAAHDSLHAPGPAPSSDSLHAAPGASAAASAPDSLPFALVRRAVLVSGRDQPGALIEPSGIAVDAFGRCFVTDAALHRLLRFDARGGLLGQSGTLGSDAGDLRRPGSVALLGTLSVAVLDVENRRVLSYDLFDRPQGTLIDFEDATLEAQLGRVDPVALASDQGGAVYVVDGDRDRLLVFDFSGRWMRTVGGFGSGPGSFRGLEGVAIGRRGDVVVTERNARRAQRLDPGGAPRAAWPLPLTRGRGTVAVAVDDSLHIAIADEAAGTLWVFDRDGRLLAASRGFDRPRALAF